MLEKALTIGYLAQLADINVETIRFYQKKGLIEKPEKPEKPSQGYRIYSEEDLSRLFFIQRAKLVGFTLAEIKALLSLGNDLNCSATKKMAQQKLSLVVNKIDDLIRIRGNLEIYINNCENNKNLDKCPIIHSFKNSD